MPTHKYKEDSNGKRNSGSIAQVLSKVDKDPNTGKWFFTYLDDNGEPTREECKSKRQANLQRARKAKEIREARDKEESSSKSPVNKKKASTSSKPKNKAKTTASKKKKTKRNLPKKAKSKEVDFSLRDHFNEILELYINGKGEYYISTYLHEHYGVSLSNVVNQIIPRFKKELQEHISKKAEDIILNHVHRYETLYSWFYTNGMFRPASVVLQKKEKLLGLNENLDEINVEYKQKTELGLILDKKYIRKERRLNKLLGKVSKINNA